jgi:hypothetical protein
MKCGNCGKLFDTRKRGQNALTIMSGTPFCSKECRVKTGTKRLVAKKRQRANPDCEGGLRKFNCPHCGDKIETYRTQLKYCGKDECKAIQQRIYQANYRGEWVEVKKGECRNCKKPFTAKVRKCKTDGRDRDHIKATAHIKYCSFKCRANYGRDYLTDSFIKAQIRRSFLKVEGMIISDNQISPQMVEDKRLLLKLDRAWKAKTGKHHPSRYHKIGG